MLDKISVAYFVDFPSVSDHTTACSLLHEKLLQMNHCWYQKNL